MRLYRVKGNSMSPFIKEGDIVLVKKLSAEDCKKGRVLVFKRGTGERIVHRVVKGNKNGYVHVKGDKHGPCEMVSVTDVEGRVVGIVRSKKFISVNTITEWVFWLCSWFEKFLLKVKRRISFFVDTFRVDPKGV